MLKFKTIPVIISLLILVVNLSLPAQEKKAIDHTVYDDWKDLKNPVISNNGRYISFEINPQKGDGNLVFFDQLTNQYDTIPRAHKPVFGPNSNMLVFTIKPQYDTVRQAKLKKVKKDKLPKDSVGILLIDSKQIIKYPKVKDFIVPEGTSDWIAILLEQRKEVNQENDTTKKEKKKKSSKKDKDLGRLVMTNPISGDSFSFEQVKKFTFSKNGRTSAFIQVKNDSVDSVWISVFETKTKVSTCIFEKEGHAENISIDEKGRQVAYTYSFDTAKIKSYSLYYQNLKSEKQILVQSNKFDFKGEDWTVSQHGNIFFNEKGSELYFGTALRTEPESKDTLTDDEKVSLDIWNWKDPYLQPHQLKQANKEKKRSYTAVFYPDSDKTIQLGNPDLEYVKINRKAKGKYTLGSSNKKYRKEISWDASRYKDFYLINRLTGEAEKIIEKAASSISMSPAQKYVCWYNIVDSAWYSYGVATKTKQNLTSKIGKAFYNELDDIPNEAGPYGIAGWSDDEHIVIYDRFDLWLIDPSMKKDPVNLTEGEGRAAKTKLRYLKLDKELEYLPKTLLLSAFNEENKQAGFYRIYLKDRNLEQILIGDYYFGRPKKAKEADQLIWTKESFKVFPDLYSSTISFENIEKISNANPQQKEYNWGTTELVDWTTFDGEHLQGILVKPEDFDPQKKYPMLVYFYERSSNRLNRYYTPKPIRSTINWTYYASNGYLIFIPDIVYKTGYPGPSAFNCIISGTQAMCDRFDFIDRDRLGVQGQSWGGYQTAYIITQTDIFKAAMAGAPVSNMTSAYGGIRWGSGVSRAFQYEESQSRIGATLWERRDLYILNSPLFFADKINTPLLMMHNDNDGAVPWYQGIEFFNAMRRLDKPVWMLVYNKAPHNLKRRADMEDLTKRMQQFFDHFLKGAPEPIWMESGIPAVQKGKSFGFEYEK